MTLYHRFFADGQDAEKGERYIAPMYNQLIAEDALMTMHELARASVGMLGTPEQVESFRPAPLAAAAALIQKGSAQ